MKLFALLLTLVFALGCNNDSNKKRANKDQQRNEQNCRDQEPDADEQDHTEDEGEIITDEDEIEIEDEDSIELSSLCHTGPQGSAAPYKIISNKQIPDNISINLSSSKDGAGQGFGLIRCGSESNVAITKHNDTWEIAFDSKLVFDVETKIVIEKLDSNCKKVSEFYSGELYPSTIQVGEDKEQTIFELNN